MFDDASPSIREMAMSFGGMSPITVMALNAMKRAVGRCAHRYSHTNTLNLKSRFASCTSTCYVFLLSYLLVYVRTNDDMYNHVGVVVAFGCCSCHNTSRFRQWNDALVSDVCQWLGEDLPLPPGVPGGMESYRRTLTTSFFFKFYLSVLLRLQSDVRLSTAPCGQKYSSDEIQSCSFITLELRHVCVRGCV